MNDIELIKSIKDDIHRIVMRGEKTNVDEEFIQKQLSKSRQPKALIGEMIRLISDPKIFYGTKLSKKEIEDWSKWLYIL